MLHVRYATVDRLHSLGRCPFFPFSDRNGRHRSRLIVSASRNGAAASHSAFRIAFREQHGPSHAAVRAYIHDLVLIW
jgi:hypothetical protein